MHACTIFDQQILRKHSCMLHQKYGNTEFTKCTLLRHHCNNIRNIFVQYIINIVIIRSVYNKAIHNKQCRKVTVMQSSRTNNLIHNTGNTRMCKK